MANDIKGSLASLSDDEILKMLTTHFPDSRSEWIDASKEELTNRGVVIESSENDTKATLSNGEIVTYPRIQSGVGPLPETKGPKPLPPYEIMALRIAAILLFVSAVFLFINQVNATDGGQTSTSNLPLIANIIIGIGLLRPSGFLNMSQNSYRIWAIIRFIAGPIWYAFETLGKPVVGNLAYVAVGLEITIAAGLLLLLIGSAGLVRVIVGTSVSALGFIVGLVFLFV